MRSLFQLIALVCLGGGVSFAQSSEPPVVLLPAEQKAQEGAVLNTSAVAVHDPIVANYVVLNDDDDDEDDDIVVESAEAKKAAKKDTTEDEEVAGASGTEAKQEQRGIKKSALAVPDEDEGVARHKISGNAYVEMRRELHRQIQILKINRKLIKRIIKKKT